MNKEKSSKKELDHYKRKEIINSILSKLTKEKMVDLYYTSTIEIAALIHEQIHTGKLSLDEREIVEKLSIEDIQILMSLHTKM